MLGKYGVSRLPTCFSVLGSSNCTGDQSIRQGHGSEACAGRLGRVGSSA